MALPPITRRNVNIPSFGSANSLFSGASQQITSGIQGLGQAIQDVSGLQAAEQQRQQEADLLNARIAAQQASTSGQQLQNQLTQSELDYLPTQREIDSRQAAADLARTEQQTSTSATTQSRTQQQIDIADENIASQDRVDTLATSFLGNLDDYGNIQDATAAVARQGRKEGLSPDEVSRGQELVRKGFAEASAPTDAQSQDLQRSIATANQQIADTQRGFDTKILQLAGEENVDLQLLDNLNVDRGLDYNEVKAQLDSLNPTASDRIISKFTSKFKRPPNPNELEYLQTNLSKERFWTYSGARKLNEDDTRSMDTVIDDLYRRTGGKAAENILKLRQQGQDAITSLKSQLTENQQRTERNIGLSNRQRASQAETIVNPNYNLTTGFSDIATAQTNLLNKRIDAVQKRKAKEAKKQKTSTATARRNLNTAYPAYLTSYEDF